MKVVANANQKGGPGKTTLTAHLAVEAERAGAGPVAVMDWDPQGTLADWWNARQAPTPIFVEAKGDLGTQLAALKAAGIKVVFFDTPPSVNASVKGLLAHADLVLIPVRPSPNDLRAIGKTIDLVDECGKPFLFVVSQAKPAARSTSQAIAVLSGHGTVAPALISNREIYAASMTDGRTAMELAPRGPAADEISQLWIEVARSLGAGKQSRRRA